MMRLVLCHPLMLSMMIILYDIVETSVCIDRALVEAVVVMTVAEVCS